MIVIENADLIQGDATTASEVDFQIYGLDNNALKNLADGQLANSIGTLYTSDSTDVVTTIILVNSGAAHNHVNLYHKPTGGTPRRLIPKDLQLESGYSLHWEGGKCVIITTAGAIAQTIDTASFLDDTAGGTDALLTKGITSNVMYDHARLASGATAHGLVAATDPSDVAQRHVMEVINGATAWSVQDLFDATHPEALGAAATEGTSLLASHRDHVHLDPAIAHATLTTGVHGAGASTIAKLTDKIDDFAIAGTSDTTKDANTTNHGLLLKAVAPAAGLTTIPAIENGETIYKLKALYDATVPSTQAIADSAATGSAVTAARRDHKHAMPSAATMDAASVQAVEDTGLVMTDAKNIEFDPSPATSHTANGIIVTLTAGIALVFGNACYMGTDGKMEKALADDAAITIPATHLCLATIAENSAGLFLQKGWAHDDHFAFDVGKSIYLSAATAGLITKTMPTKVTGNQVQVLGLCGEIADVIYWNPSPIVMEYA